MCGILGTWWKKAKSFNADNIHNALYKMHYRGPDDKGYEVFEENEGMVVLGHTRLSIIDLSTQGHQPMRSADGRFAMVFNGEIYNYKELRKELKQEGYIFQSESDTEVLLYAWQHWGKAVLPRLIGMFSFVVYDRFNHSLTGVRDAFGIKPFVYSWQNEIGFSFSSQIDSLIALQDQKPSLNLQRAYDYLVHGEYDTNEDTFFNGVHHLKPGHLIEVSLESNAQPLVSPWWKPSIIENKGLSFREAAQLVREQFLDNIRFHLRSDVPIGAALSGGIDSSAVVAAMRHVEPDMPINTFSYIAKGSKADEEKWVDIVNQHVKATAYKVQVHPQELVQDIDELIRIQGEPFGSTSIYAQYRVFQLAKEKGVTVTLEGQGADEMLAGYMGYPGQRLHSLLESGQFLSVYQFLQQWSKTTGKSKTVGLKLLANQLLPETLNHLARKIDGRNAVPSWIHGNALLENGVNLRYPYAKVLGAIKGRRVMAELAYSLTQRGLTHLLRHGDRNSMAHSVEGRVPFLTIDMANLLLSLPESYLISDKGVTKYVFREAMRGIVPDSILDRRDKVGFETPEYEWLREMKHVFEQWLKEDLNLSFLNQQEILREFEEVLSGKKPFSWQVWRWINFFRWYRVNV